MNLIFKNRILVILFLATLSMAIPGCQRSSSESTSGDLSPNNPEHLPSAIRVKCIIEFNGRRERIESDVELKSDNATAHEALKTLAEKENLKLESRGSGESCFVVPVGGFGNEGAGGKNWVYKVDGKLGDRSSGVFQVRQNQEILWSLGRYPSAD